MGKPKSRSYMKKIKATSQHGAINTARKRAPKSHVLKVRTANQSKRKKGVYWVIGILKPRQRSSKLGKLGRKKK